MMTLNHNFLPTDTVIVWQLRADLERGSEEYERLKEERSQVMWRAVERIIPDIRQRCEITMVRAASRPPTSPSLAPAACFQCAWM